METSVKPCSFQSVSELGGKGEEAEEEEESVSRWQRRRASHVGRSGGCGEKNSGDTLDPLKKSAGKCKFISTNHASTTLTGLKNKQTKRAVSCCKTHKHSHMLNAQALFFTCYKAEGNLCMLGKLTFSFQFRNHFVDQSGVIELETGHGAEAGLS